MPNLPPVVLDSFVDAEDRLSAIDFINRVNLLFDAGDLDAMAEAFLPDSVTYHPGGVVRGRSEIRGLLQEQALYSAPGVSRIATNPIVDRDGEGVIVRYHNLLIRYAADVADFGMVTAEAFERPDDLPAIWVYSAMTDRLRPVGSGWRIFERHIATTTVNERLHPALSTVSSRSYNYPSRVAS